MEFDGSERTTLQFPRFDAKTRIHTQINKGNDLLSRRVSSDSGLEKLRGDAEAWSEYNKQLLIRMFDNNYFITYYNKSITNPKQPNDLFGLIELARYTIRQEIRRLESIHKQLELIPEPSSATPSSGTTPPINPVLSNRVFIVHGHDEAAKESVARVIERLGFEPIILQERTNEGRTIIEKFEDYADVAFAIVLLTPDDLGAVKTAPQALQGRARQNVILELGYFIAKLGRRHVCALHKGNVELPSDILGVVWTPMDSGNAWKTELAKEMRAAGLPIDLNKL